MAKKKIHRGEVLDSVVRRSHLSITQIVKLAGYDRGSYYGHIKKPELAYTIIDKYGIAMGYDFTADFPDMMKSIAISEPEIEYLSEAQAKEELRKYKKKYYQVLEKYHDLLEKTKGEG